MVHILILFSFCFIITKSLFAFGISGYAFFCLLITTPIILYKIFFNEKSKLLIALVLILLGYLLNNYIENKIIRDLEEYNSGFVFDNKDGVTLKGKVSKFPSYRFSNNQYIVSIDSYSTNILLYTNPHQKYKYLDQIEFIASPQNVLEQDKQWHKYYKKLNVHYVIWSADILNIENQNKGSLKEIFLYKIFQFKLKIKELSIEKFSSYTSSLILGMILGEKDELSKEEKEIFNKANLSHILVVSGYNISLVISFAFVLLKFLERNSRTFFAIIFVLIFVFIVRFDPSVVRSALMGIIIIVGRLIYRESGRINTLLLVATIMILHSPIIIFDIGFHLSFIATFALCVLPNFKKIPEYLSGIIWVYIFIVPYTILLSNSVSFIGILTNFAVLIFVPIFMFISVSSLLLNFIGINIILDKLFLEILSRYIFLIANLSSYAPRLEIEINKDFVFGFYLVVFSLIIFYLNRYNTFDFIEKFYQNYPKQRSN